MKNVLLAGGSGLIGAALTEALKAEGYNVAILSRSPQNLQGKTYGWDTKSGVIDPDAVPWSDVIINLAGAGIADKRWTSERKKILLESRTQSTDLLVQSILRSEHPKHLINASAVGYYGNDSNPKTEADESGKDFMATICRKWEESLVPLQNQSKHRCAIARIGVVMTPEGGALAKMLPLLRLGIPHYFGSGRQYWSWIHMDDIVGGLLHIVRHGKDGIYNLTAPQPVTQRTFCRKAKESQDMFFPCIPVPGILLKLLLGEMSAVVLGGNHILPSQLVREGYQFHHPEIGGALSDLLSR